MPKLKYNDLKNKKNLTLKEKKKLEKMEKVRKEKVEMKKKAKLKKDDPELYEKLYPLLEQIDTKLRTKEERVKEVEILKEKLSETGFYDSLTGYQKFCEYGEIFIETGNRIEETIKFEEIPGVKLFILLTPKKTVECGIRVKNWNGGSNRN